MDRLIDLLKNVDPLKDLIVPMVIGVVSSICFLFLISRVRPRLEISKHIAYAFPNEDACRPGCFLIKVINKSGRSATEVNARLAVIRKFNVAGGQINQRTEIPLINCPFEIPGKRGRKQAELEESAFRFAAAAPIEELWTGNNVVSFSIVAKDALSGFGRVFTENYYSPADVLREGEFEIGHSMNITPPLARPLAPKVAERIAGAN